MRTNKKRVVFVDYDGVLNDPHFLRHNISKGISGDKMLDPKRVSYLKMLCDQTGAKVVLTSSWRYDMDAREYLKRCGITIMGATPHKYGNRGLEIRQWLNDKHFTGDYVILDDEASDLNATQREHLIYTREGGNLGLKKKHILFAKTLFQKYNPTERANENIITAVLEAIENDLLRIMWNIRQNDTYDNENPFRNTGNVKGFSTEIFEVHAYDWGWGYDDDISKPQPVNFKWRDIEICWYKWCGRGISTNRPITNNEIAMLLNECLTSLRNYEEAHDDNV